MEALTEIISDFFNSIDPKRTNAGLKSRTATLSCPRRVPTRAGLAARP
jgi:hypothetical protein